jgi:CDP-diacylglycerol--inositol 3-phosphatidyltransferase
MAPSTTAAEVLLFVPNLIGYARVACTLAFLYLARDRASWHVALSSYIVSFALDLFDGMAARRFHQTSRFGAVLDMVTDRCSTAVMLAVLAHLYAGAHPRAFDAFIALMVLDVASHWVQMKAAGDMHHKSSSRNFIVRFYYEKYWFFGYCCVGAEFFYIFMYGYFFVDQGSVLNDYTGGMHVHGPDGLVYKIAVYGMLPGCLIKQFVNVCQLSAASASIAAADAAEYNAKSQ